MFIRALIAFIALPGIFAIIMPLAIAYVDPWKGSPFIPGIAVIVIGCILLLWCVRDFYVIGKGTRAPWDAPNGNPTVGTYQDGW